MNLYRYIFNEITEDNNNNSCETSRRSADPMVYIYMYDEKVKGKKQGGILPTLFDRRQKVTW